MESTVLSRYLPLIGLLLLAAFSALLHQRALEASYSHPDEEIARAVVTKILTTKSKDTNWARTDVAPPFRYNQYNFSSYYLAAAKLEKLEGHKARDFADPNILIRNLRQQNIWMGAFCVFLAGLLATRLTRERRFAAVAGFVAAALTACCVTLFQDDIYARPEAFVTALTLFYIVILTSERDAILILACSGILVGVLLAAKITFAAYLPFPPLMVAVREYTNSYPRSPRWKLAAGLLIYPACILAGFAVGAPYALHAPREYLEGIFFLYRHYDGSTWHDGLHNGASFPRLGHGIEYLIYTQGVIPLMLAAASLVAAVRERRYAVIFAVAGPLLTLLYFLQTRVFFERNFSHALPVLFVLSGMGCATVASMLARARSPRLQTFSAQTALVAVLAFFAIYPGYAVSALLYQTMFSQDDLEKQIRNTREEIANRTAVPILFGYSDFENIAKLRNGLCGDVIYQMLDFGGDRKLLSNLDQQGYRLEQVLRSPFDGAPYSSLQQYHSSNVVFLHSPPDPPEQRCTAQIIVPDVNPAYREVNAEVRASSNWTRDGYPPDMSLDGWPHPFYASWNGDDSNTGDFAIGPFQACGDLIVPYAIGPVRGNTELKIERDLGDFHEIITQGPPPPSLSRAAIRVPAASSCASYTIRASDRGAGWGEWIGVGMPVELQISDSPLPSH